MVERGPDAPYVDGRLDIGPCPTDAAFILTEATDDDERVVVVSDLEPKVGEAPNRTLPEGLGTWYCSLAE